MTTHVSRTFACSITCLLMLSILASIARPADAQVTALANDTPSLNQIFSTKEFSFTAKGYFYTVVAARSDDAWTESPTDYDISLYNDVGMTSYVNASTTFPTVDAIVVDRQGLPDITMYANVEYFNGDGLYASVEAEYNLSTLPVNTTITERFDSNEIIDEWDHYITAGRTYEIELTEVPNGANYNIYLFTSGGSIGNGGTTGYSAMGNQSTPIIYTATQTKWACVLVTNENNVLGTYKVTSRDIELQNDMPRKGTINVANKNDRYRFVAKGGEYSVVAMLPPTSSDFDLKTYTNLNLTGDLVSSTMGNGLFDICVFDRVGLSAATYYAAVDRWSGAGEYTIEKDGKRAISIGSTYNETINSTEIIDTFQVQLTAGVQYRISIPNAPAGANYELYLFNATGCVYSMPQSTGFVAKGTIASPITFTPATTKQHMIVVTNLNAIYGTFGILVEEIASEPIQVLSNNVPYVGTFDGTNTYDVFRFTVAPASYTTIALRPPADQDFDIQIYSDASLTTSVASSNRGTGLIDACIFNGFTLSSSVTYYAKAYRYGTSTGQYTIECDSRDALIMGNYTTRTMVTNGVVETFWIDLSSGEDYIINLPPPSAAPVGANYWFYVFNGNASISGAISGSPHTSGMLFRPTTSGHYGLVIFNLFNATGEAPTGTYKFRARQIFRLSEDIPQTHSLNTASHDFDEFNFTVTRNSFAVVAIKPSDPTSNYNLEMYSNIWMGPTYFLGTSSLSSNLTDAYVMNGFAETSSRPYFALATEVAGTGNYIVEADSEWNLTVGTTYNSYMGPGTLVDIYWCYLNANTEYMVSMPTIPAGATYKLYAFGGSGPLSSAITPTSSTATSITFTPVSSQHYGILVVSESLTPGSFQIRVVENNAPDFAISVSPASQSVYAGSSTQYSVTLTGHDGFSSPVTLTVPWLPTGATYSFSPASPLTPPATTTLTISTAASTPIGTYNNITIRATSGALVHTSAITLTVNPAPANADLVPWSYGFYPTAWAISNVATTINVSVANIGSMAVSSSFAVALHIDGSPTAAHTWNVASLGIGQRANLSTPYTFTTAGTHTIEVRVDSGGAITEEDETNNIASDSIDVAQSASSGATYSGSLSTAGQTYIYALQYSAGASHEFNLTGTSGTDFDIYLYDAHGMYLDSSASIYYPEVINYTSAAGGWHFLVVELYDLPSGTYTLTIDGTAGPTPDFSISPSPGTATVVAGNMASYTISVSPTGGFSNVVTFSTQTLTFDGSASFTPTAVSSPYTGGTTLSLSTTSSATPGTYSVTIVATSGAITHQTTVQIQINAPLVPTFTLSASPSMQTVTAGNSTSYTLTLTSVNGFNNLVTLSVTTWPTGSSGTFTPAQLTVSSTHTSTLSVATQTTMTEGTYTITINANGGSVTQSASIQITVNAPSISDFALTPLGETQMTVIAGNPASFGITATSIGAFASSITFSYASTPSGISGAFSPSSVTLTAGGSASSTLTFTTSSTPTGMYDIVVSGTSGGTTNDMPTHIKLTIQPAPLPAYFSMMLDPSSVTVVQGSEAIFSVAINSHFGFTGTVTLDFENSPSIITENSVFMPPTASPGNPSTLTIDTSLIPAGTYDFTLSGISGTLTNGTTGKLIVSNPPDFGIAATPSSFTIDARTSITYNITVGALNGFSGAVALSTPSLAPGLNSTFQPQLVIVSGTPATARLTINSSGCANADATFQIRIRGMAASLTHECTVSLTLRKVNRPPVITSFSPASVMVSVDEGTSQEFNVVATDAESTPTIAWFLNGAENTSGNSFTFSPDFDAAQQFNGVYKICARATDGTYYVWQNWTVTVENVNRAPVAKITMPEDGASFLSGTPMGFDGTQSSDPDGDPLSYEWRDGEVPISADGMFETQLSPGLHAVTLVVSDGTTTASTSITVNVKYYSVNVSALNPSKPKATAGDKLTIKAFLNNSGDSDSPDLLVRFLVDSKIVDNRTGIKVTKGASVTLDFTWKAIKGTHIIKVEIDDGNNANDKMIPIPVKAKAQTSSPGLEVLPALLAIILVGYAYVRARRV